MDKPILGTLASEEESGRAELIRRFSSDDIITGLVRQAVRAAVLEHKRNGNPVAGSVNGKVVIFQPEEIDVRENDDC